MDLGPLGVLVHGLRPAFLLVSSRYLPRGSSSLSLAVFVLLVWVSVLPTRQQTGFLMFILAIPPPLGNMLVSGLVIVARATSLATSRETAVNLALSLRLRPCCTESRCAPGSPCLRAIGPVYTSRLLFFIFLPFQPAFGPGSCSRRKGGRGYPTLISGCRRQDSRYPVRVIVRCHPDALGGHGWLWPPLRGEEKGCNG